MNEFSLIQHAPGAPGLRLLGLGPHMRPINGLSKLKNFFHENAFWANNRNKDEISQMLANSQVIVSLWDETRLIGFGRATSDMVYRAVLWDIVIASDLQRLGLGKLILEALLESNYIKNVEKVYLMTTNSSDFYQQLGFKVNLKQTLLIFNKMPIKSKN